jgi:carboxymethylenebutenolidase
MEKYSSTRTNVTYSNEEITFSSVLCTPKASGTFPAIITIHGIFGLQEMDKLFAERLSEEGYIVLAHGWQSAETDPSDDDLVSGIYSALTFLKSLNGVDHKFGLVGVCRGGSISMITGAKLQDFSMLVSFYGQSYYPMKNSKKPISPIQLTEHINSPILIIHGEEDTVFPFQESIDYANALQKLGKAHEIHTYPKAQHGFFLEGHRNYHEKASKEAWKVLKEFLKKHL